MKKISFSIVIMFLIVLFGCEKIPTETLPTLTENVPTVTMLVETTEPPETMVPPEITETFREYVPQNPDPDIYPAEELQATVIQYMGLLYVRDNRADSLLGEIPEECVWLGITRISSKAGRPKFDLYGCHIPEGAAVYGAPQNPDYLYYRAEDGWQRMIRAGLVENYWDDQEDPAQIPGDATVLWFHSLLNSYAIDNLYNHAVGSWFETPADVNICELFYNGFPEEKSEAFSSSEQSFLKENLPAGEVSFSNVERLPVETMDVLLRRFFDILFEDINGVGLERFDVYWSQTDCYYKWTGDVYSNYPVVAEVTVDEAAGIYTVRYYAETVEGKREYGTLTLLKNGDVLQVVSNLPADS